MIKDTLSKIEAAISHINSLDAKNKTELLGLLGKLKTEVETLPAANAEEARSIANFVQTAAHEAARAKSDAKLQDLSLEGLRHSVKSFEVSHPVLVDTVDEICRMLAQIGI